MTGQEKASDGICGPFDPQRAIGPKTPPPPPLPVVAPKESSYVAAPFPSHVYEANMKAIAKRRALDSLSDEEVRAEMKRRGLS